MQLHLQKKSQTFWFLSWLLLHSASEAINNVHIINSHNTLKENTISFAWFFVAFSYATAQHRHRQHICLSHVGTDSKLTAVWPPSSPDTVCPHPSVTLTFDRLTLKPVCKSQLRWGTFIQNLGTLGLRVLELFTMYATNDRQADKVNAYWPLPYGQGHSNVPTLSTT